MAKRIREDREELDAPSAKRNGLQVPRRQLEIALEHSKKSVFRALKIGRGFERQKLGRRQKQAMEKGASQDELARLDAEVAALKSLDLEAIAKMHIFKSLVKTKSIVSAPAFPKHILKAVEKYKASSDVAYANITARLFNSNPVKEAMVEVMATARRALGVEQPERKEKKQRAGKIDTTSNNKMGDILAQTPATHFSASSQTDDGWDGFEDSGAEVKPEPVESIEEDSDEFEQYKSRLAPHSSNEEFEDNDPGLRREPSYSPIRTKPSSAQTVAAKFPPQSLSPSPSPSTSPSLSISSRSSSPGPFRHPAPVPLSAKSTTFLPSLSLAGYYSGNSSDSEGNEPRENGQKVRKNRMGQQARRALWEKKYGAGAKHVQQTIKTEGRDQGWDPRKGAVEEGSRGRERGFSGVRAGATSGRPKGRATGANTDPLGGSRDRRAEAGKVAKKAPADEKGKGVNHPSWEAARRAKESLKNVAPTGKKTVFD
ncbi:MAG: hypothetical protein MMC33_010528 [Icmadophila ericetorum]|nr:hypothetical protein [Icmadophila ericetorum]